MGITKIFNTLFGVRGGRNAITDTIEVFRPNAEASAQRAADRHKNAQAQFSSEFITPERKGWFNALVDGLNRLPRPIIAFGVISLFCYAMQNPPGFAERMAGLELVPEQLWWLFGAIITFYFGARELHHNRDVRFVSPERVQRVVQNVRAIRSLREDSVGVAVDDTETGSGDGDNAAIEEWKVSE